MSRAKRLLFLSAIVLLTLNAPLWASEQEMFSIDDKKIPAACTFTGWSIEDYDWFRHPTTVAAATSIASLEDHAGRKHAVLRMPGCEIKEYEEPPHGETVDGMAYDLNYLYYVPSGKVLYSCKPDWCITQPGSATKHYTLAGKPTSGSPILSDDGKWVLWLEVVPENKPIFVMGKGTMDTLRIHAMEIDGKKEHIIALPEGSDKSVQHQNQIELMGADMAKGDITVFWAENYKPETNIFAVNTSGKVIWKVEGLGSLRPSPSSFIRLSDGWLAWETTKRELEPIHMVWNLHGKTRQYEVPKSYQSRVHGQIDHAAISSDEKYIVLSVGSHSRGWAKNGFLQLIRADDNKTLLNIPMDTEIAPDVAFVGNNLLFRHFNKKIKQHEIVAIPLP